MFVERASRIIIDVFVVQSYIGTGKVQSYHSYFLDRHRMYAFTSGFRSLRPASYTKQIIINCVRFTI